METIVWYIFLLLFSSATTAFGMRLLLPLITSIPWSPVSMLDEWGQIVYETESYVFITSVLVFLLIFISGVVLEPFFRKKIPLLTSIARWGICAVSLAIILQPFNQYLVPVNSTTVLITVIAYVGFWLFEKQILHRDTPQHLMWGIVTVLLAKICLPIFFRFDTGVNPDILKGDYFPIELTTIGLSGLWLLSRKSVILKKLQSVLSRQVVGIAVFICITAILLRLMIYVLPVGTNYDIYLMVSPAYSLIKGATPFVDYMSMYGILSLWPWIIWLASFPSLPVSPAMSIVVTTVSLILYFAVFLYVTGKLINRSVIWILVTLSVFYYAFMVRSYVPGDTASLLSFPATTPLRFGMFLAPFWIFVQYVQTGRQHILRWFLTINTIFLLFSFEMGTGWLAAGIAVTAFSLFTIKRSRVFTEALNLASCLVVSVAVLMAIVTGAVYLITGALPNLATYTYYPRFFGASGYYMLPVGMEISYWVHVLTAVLGFIWGMYIIRTTHNRRGLIYIYLSLIQFTMIPYYMGRSLFQTLFTITIPSVMLWGLLVDDALNYHAVLKKNIAASFIVFLLVIALCFSSWRMVYQSLRLWKDPFLQTTNIMNFIHKAITDWPVKQTPQYAFLKRHLPEGCPLVSFDSLEYELPPALRVRPALNYPQLRFMVITYEQIDSFIPNYRNGFYCLFMNKNEYEHVITYGIYEYFWLKIEGKATKIAEDSSKGFVLYTIPK